MKSKVTKRTKGQSKATSRCVGHVSRVRDSSVLDIFEKPMELVDREVVTRTEIRLQERKK